MSKDKIIEQEDKLTRKINDLFFEVGAQGKMLEFNKQIKDFVVAQRKDAIENLGLQDGQKYKIMKSDNIIVMKKIDD